jgi:MSHA type pilus biogenesis protein MshL
MAQEQRDLLHTRDEGIREFESSTVQDRPVLVPELPRYNPLDETRISISVRNEPLNDVLFVVVRNAGLDLVIDPEISLDNRVTISFQDALSSDVVRSLLGAYDVHWSVRDNVLTVERFEERTFNLEFMNAKSQVISQSGGNIFGSSDGEGSGNNLSGTFQLSSSQSFTMEDGSLYAGLQKNIESILGGADGRQGASTLNPMSGSIYVQTTPRRMSTISAMITQLREKLSRQVIIDAQILEVALSDGFDLGIDWNFVQKRVHDGRGYAYGLGANADTGLGTRGNTGSALSAIVLGDPTLTTVSNTVDTIFQATVNALQTFGGVRVVSNPHVRTRHGMPALVTSGTTKNYVKEITRETNTDSDVVNISTTTASAFEGVMLGVIPFITNDGSIDLQVFPITSKVDLSQGMTFVDGSGVTLPVVDVRNINTSVRAHSGDTVILGGLIYKDARKTDSAVPGLADIPGLGWAFNNREDAEQVRELVVVMHIRVVG